MELLGGTLISTQRHVVILSSSSLDCNKIEQDGKRLTPMKYFAFLLNVRNREADYLFQMGASFKNLPSLEG